jgi:hypothetical protein
LEFSLQAAAAIRNQGLGWRLSFGGWPDNMARRAAPRRMKIEDENEDEDDSPSIRVSSVAIRG